MRDQSEAHRRFRADVDRVPKTDAETERAELEKFAAGDVEAGKRIVAGNIRYALHVARAFSGHNQRQYEECVSAALEGLSYAITKFDPTRGTRFWSYAQSWVVVRIQRHLTATRRIVATPRNGPTTQAVHAARKHNPATVEELAELAGITVEQAAVAWPLATLSDAYMGDYEAMCPDGAPSNVTGSQRADSGMYVANDPTDRMAQAVTARKVGRAVLALRPIEQAVCRYRLMADEPKTLAEIAEEHGVCRERVRQVEIETIEKLRRRLWVFGETA
jgi:RNA polymerase sigma factor (sigma-70 family)